MGVMLDKLPGLVDPLPGGRHLISGVDYIVNWARANSLWPLVYGTSCCAIEMMATGGSHQDWSRFGVEVARASPRQADLIILAGTIVEKLAPRLVTLYEQMPAPKYVIAMGSCTCTGGPFFYDSYSVVKGADRLIPVDVYIPGCPPRPEALLYGIMKLQELIKRDSIRNPRRARPLFTLPFRDEHTVLSDEWDAKEKVRQEQMKAAQEQFKKDNPNYKGWTAQRVPKPAFEEVQRAAPKQAGLANDEIARLVRESFPAATLRPVAGDPVPDFEVAPDAYVDLVWFLRRHPELAMDFLIELTAIDWKDRFEIVVHLLSTTRGHKVFLRVPVARDNPEVATISHLHRGAEWHEREVFDLFGIRFTGHPDLRRIFLEDDFPGHPLRKDYEDPSRVVKRPY
jgi:NADH-quinone oxidoreductase B subunit